MMIKHSWLIYIGAILVAISYGSCTTYYYSALESNDRDMAKDQNGRFVLKDDSLDVIYRFGGEDAPIYAGIINKSSHPLYIDWQKSGIETDGHFEPFEQPLPHELGDENTKEQSNFYERNLKETARLGYVAPRSEFDKQVLELAGFKFNKINNNSFREQPTSIFETSKNRRAIKYEEDNSPVFFTTILTVYDNPNNRENAKIYENNFYASEIIKAGKLSPDKVKAINDKRGDVFYVKHEKGKTAKKVGIISLKVIGAVFYYTFKVIEIILSGDPGN